MTFTCPATPADDAFVLEMARHASVIGDWPLPDVDSNDTLGLLPTGDGPTILAHDHTGVPIGAVWVVRHDPALVVDDNGLAAPELVIGVTPDRRGQGVGGALLDELVARCNGRYDALSLHVHQRNPAARLYERKGFRVHGPGRGALGIAMVREL